MGGDTKREMARALLMNALAMVIFGLVFVLSAILSAHWSKIQPSKLLSGVARLSSAPNSTELPRPVRPPSTLNNSSFRRHERVVVVTKVHGHNPAEGMLKQCLCLFTAAYNFRAQYDIVVFATDLTYFTNATLPDPMSVKDELLALPEQDRALFLKQCNTTIDAIDKMGPTPAWFIGCSHIGRINYGWQAEFRSKQIWQHPALAKYRYMLWLDTDAFSMSEWPQDPVDYFIQNDLVLLFDHFPQGDATGPEVQDRLHQAFGTGLCTVKIKQNGRMQVRTAKNCRSSMPLVHGMLHMTDLDFYRSPLVKNFTEIWIGNTKYARKFDDQGAVSAPAYFLAPDRTADMRRSGIELGVFHNFKADGQEKTREYLAKRNVTSKAQGFNKIYPTFAASGHFPRSNVCKPYIKYGT